MCAGPTVLAPRLRMSGATHLLLLYTFVAWMKKLYLHQFFYLMVINGCGNTLVFY